MDIEEKFLSLKNIEVETLAIVNDDLGVWINKVFVMDNNDDFQFNFYKIFFDVKKKYLQSMDSKYTIFDRYISNYLMQYEFGKSKQYMDSALSLFDMIVKAPSFSERIEKFSSGYRIYKTEELRYKAFKKLIDQHNSSCLDKSKKYPDFDNFEIGILIDYNKKNKSQSVLIQYLESTTEQNRTLIEEIKKKEALLSKELNKTLDELFLKERVFRDLKHQNDLSQNQNDMFRAYLPTIESSNVDQFNNLVWGDNYPALKVFFNFLKKNDMVYLGWSVFANSMSENNSNTIHISNGKFTNDELGYLLYHLRLFFTNKISKTVKEYKEWLKQKFYIEGVQIEDSFFNKHVRKFEIKQNKQTQKKDLINNRNTLETLIMNIRNAYY
ncbi:hypothetical protein ES677_05290 [Bizionia gelidisalsuginis]|uniref:Uncharacterized protein n=1 Tax=Bizionia gelidisalsuginis TaxID=291188 RepID=A0ABY3MBV2_9FLAO|nr:hypothetical protein [Bizionia gelidisalsuginis]TYC14795.1 hypothetical protein ES677_05290 [Bizionia gelidisalsuginis]